MPPHANVKYLALSIGVASMGTQIILLRQFLTVFYGNELFVGFILAIWLFWVGIGSFIGQRLWSGKSTARKAVVFLSFLTFTWTLFSFIVIKAVRHILSIPYGEYIPITSAVLFSFFILSLPCLLFGILFALSASFARSEKSEAAAFVYTFEAIGAVGIGLLTTLLFYFTSNLVALLVVFVMAVIPLWLAERRAWLLLFVALLVVLLLSPLPHKFETALLQYYWRSVAREMRLQDWTSTPFGEACLVDWQGERVFYQNGEKTTVIGDSVNVQTLAAEIMCSHPSPERVLVIEGAVSGLAAECAGFGRDVSNISIDEKAFHFVRARPDSGAGAWAQTENPRLWFDDARRRLSKSDEKWDVIALNAGRPYSAAANRYYTKSFFQLVRSRLSPGGVFVICNFPSGENYLGPELLQLNKILWNTLRSEFEYTSILPGDAAMFFAANEASTLTSSPDELIRRYERLSARQQYFHPSMFRYLFMPERIQRMRDLLSGAGDGRINTDFKPISYLYDMLIWHKMVRGENRLYRRLANAPVGTIAVPLFVLSALLAIGRFFIKTKFYKVFRIHSIAVVIGFAAMALNIILILAFQTLFGYIYSWIGVAVAGFMAGTALGSGVVNHYLSRLNAKRLLQLLLMLVLLFCLLLLPIITIIAQWRSTMLYFMFILWSGALTGAAFPLLCRIYAMSAMRTNLGGIYAADVFGGAFGALLISGLLIPLYGFWATLLLTAGLCAMGFLLLFE